MTRRSEVVFIGGRCGVGKTSVAAEMYRQLSEDHVTHCLIEGDSLDLAFPVPWEQGLRLAEANLADMWANFKATGYSRLIFTNTACVRGDVLPDLLAALVTTQWSTLCCSRQPISRAGTAGAARNRRRT